MLLDLFSHDARLRLGVSVKVGEDESVLVPISDIMQKRLDEDLVPAHEFDGW